MFYLPSITSFIEQQVLPCEEVPEEDYHCGNQFGEHIMEVEQVGTYIHDQLIEPEPYHPDDSKKEELLPSLHSGVLLKDPTDTEQIVGDQS